jgi:hypothetical protein
MFQKHSDNSRGDNDSQMARLRPDEKPEANEGDRERGSMKKLSSRGKKHHRRGKRKSHRR